MTQEPRVFDCFVYGGERNFLDLRIALLGSEVDVFVIVEGRTTFTGLPRNVLTKPDLDAVFDGVADFEHVVVSLEGFQTAWQKEHAQRNAIARGLVGAGPNDLIIVGDVDEIPRPDIVRTLKHKLVSPVNLEMSWNAWSANLAYRRPWLAAKAARLCQFTSVQELRDAVASVTVTDAGWHLSWQMTPSEAMAKLSSFAHTELNTNAINNRDFIRRCALAGVDLIGREILHVVPKSQCVPLEFAGSLSWANPSTLPGRKARMMLKLEAAGRYAVGRRWPEIPRWCYCAFGLVSRTRKRVFQAARDVATRRWSSVERWTL